MPYQVFSNQKRHSSKEEPKVSLIIGFYNNLRFFELQMASLEAQTFQDFEVILCDDGSKTPVVEEIHRYMEKTPLMIQHLWHADMGWRKVEMLNKALVASRAPYVVFIDQDCVLHPEFIREHYENRDENRVLTGRRAELTDFLSHFLTRARILSAYLQKNYWWMFFFMFYRKDTHWFKGLYFQNTFLRHYFNRKRRPILGCNFSVYKKHLLTVNGFNMSYQRPCGAEDSDVGYRLKNLGLEDWSVCHMAVQYHLWHPLRSAPIEIPPEFQENQRNGCIKTNCGVDLIPAVEKIFI
ncbi:glycosyltransferase [bacterium]|nr:glycosyltransferase [bacterium]